MNRCCLKYLLWRESWGLVRRGKLNPWYIGPFEVLEDVGLVAYRLAFLPELFVVYLVFHMSKLKMYHRDGDYIIKWDSILLNKNLAYEVEAGGDSRSWYLEVEDKWNLFVQGLIEISFD